MSPTKSTLLALLALAFASATSTGARSSARADDPPTPVGVPVGVPAPLPEPSPLTGAPPKNPAAAAVDAAAHRLDAAARRATGRAFADHAAGVAAPAEGDASPATMPTSGRTGLRTQPSPSAALNQLQRIDTRTTGVQLEPTLEIAHTIAQEAWGWMIEQSNQVVIVQGRTDPYFQGRFKPMSVDDLPPVLAIRVAKSTTVVPPPDVPIAPPASTKSWIPRDFLPKGVLIGFDEAAIRDAMAAGSIPTVAQVDAAEAALLAAGGDETAATAALRSLQTAAAGAPGRDATVTSVSLKAAVEAARGASSAGSPRPFGGITRVVGVVLGEDGDVRVLGRVVEGAPPLLLDDVVTTLATVWRDDLTPGCSLDPEPRDPGGPQHVRVLAVPRDSAFAKTMLEADYAMKKILFGIEDVGVAGLRGLPELLLEELEGSGERGAEQRNRFWLCAVPPRPGDLAISSDRRTLALTCGVEARTERLLLGERGETGTGKTSPSAEIAAKAFSERYDAIARARPVFRRLEGLFDLVLLARALRVVAPDHPLLTAACGVAREPVAVPTSYPGVSTSRSSPRAWVTITGGCEVGIPFERRVLRQLSEDDARRIATAALAGGTSTLRLPGGTRPAAAAMGVGENDDLVAATMALVAGDAPLAIAHADSILDRDPSHARARALRAEGFRAAGRPAAALRDARIAAALEPDDVTFAVLVRRLRMDEEGAAALEDALPAVRAGVVQAELLAAVSALASGDSAGALVAVSRALLADPASFEASAVGASAAWLEGDLDAADAHVARAQASKPAAPEPRVMRAMVLLSRRRGVEARADLDAAVTAQPEADTLGLRAFVRLLQGEVAGAAEDAARGLSLAPRSDLAAGAATAVEMADHAPLETVQRYVADMLALPPRAMAAVGSALSAAQQGNASGAAAAYEEALAALDAAERPPDLARTRIELALLGLVPSSAAAMGRSVEDVRARMDALTAALESRGDAPVSANFARALAENSLGERDAAVARIEAACEAIGSPDATLAELFPGTLREVEALLRTIQMAALMANPVELLQGERAPALLARIGALLEGGPGAPGAQGLAEYVAAVREDPSGNRLPEGFAAAMGRRVAEVSKAFSAGKPSLADAVVAAIFLSMAAQTEAAMGELSGAEGAARALWTLPMPHEMSPHARVLIPTLRAQTANALFDRWMREAERDPELALSDSKNPAEVARWNAALDARRKRAEALGEPAFALLFDARIGTIESGEVDEALVRRKKSIERVLEVAAPGPKRDRLSADLAAVEREIREAEGKNGGAIRERIARAYAAAKTLSQLRTLDKVLVGIASKAGPDAVHWVAPPDAGLDALKRALERARDRAKGSR